MLNRKAFQKYWGWIDIVALRVKLLCAAHSTVSPSMAASLIWILAKMPGGAAENGPNVWVPSTTLRTWKKLLDSA